MILNMYDEWHSLASLGMDGSDGWRCRMAAMDFWVFKGLSFGVARTEREVPQQGLICSCSCPSRALQTD